MKLLGIVLFCLLLMSCSSPPAVEAIEGIMDEIQQAVEDKDNSAVMKHILDGFRGNEHMDKNQLRKFLIVHFLRHNNINVVMTRMDIQHDPALPYYATMEGVVAVTGADNLLPDDGRIYAITGRWEQHDGDWLLAELNWQ